MRRPLTWLLVPFGFVALVLMGGLLSPISATTIDPTAYTTRIGASSCTTYPTTCLSRDSFGNPYDATFTISSAQPTSYAICLKIFGTAGTDYPSFNNKVAQYNAYLTGGTLFGYSASGSGSGTYKTCKAFSWSSGSSNSHKLSNYFAFGGPATYEVDWYAPGIPTFDGTGAITNSVVQVGAGAPPSSTPQTFLWAKSGAAAGVWSPCPWNPQLQIGVWRTSRFQVLNRCAVRSGTVTSRVKGPNSLDSDRSWGLASRHTEYVKRDGSGTTAFLPNPPYGSTWTIVGVSVCDLYHGQKEFHPVFQATDSGGTTYLSGPQYSTVVPSVSGTWSLHSC